MSNENTTATTDVEGVSGDQLKSIIERIEQVDSEIADLNEGRKELFAEAKGNGFDTKIIRQIIALRKLDADEREEIDSIRDLYMQALGMA